MDAVRNPGGEVPSAARPEPAPPGALAGTVGPTLLWPLAALIITVQAAYSALWLRRFRFGPLEWLWRTLTYGRIQPIHVDSPTLGAS